MSVLETPRLYFKGEMTFDPITTNNTPSSYNEVAAKTVFPAGADPVGAFRRQAISAVAAGSWNPDGTHRATLINCEIVGCDVGAGLATNDPAVGAALRLNGMLVDLEPYGGFTSQIFFDEMSAGVAGGYSIRAPSSGRITGRYISFARNTTIQGFPSGYSVIWQTSFDKTHGLELQASDSRALGAFEAALKDEQTIGITLRFNAYLTRLVETGADLTAKLNKGGFQPNPARSRIVGVIGLWRRGEPATEPGDRPLLPSAAGTIGTLFARVDDNRLTLDLGNSISETDATGAKQNLGDLTLVAVDSGGHDAAVLGVLASNAYDQQSYERAAGFATLDLTPAAATAARTNDLVVRDSTGAELAREARFRAIPEAPNSYRDEGQATDLRVQIYDRGAVAAQALSVSVFPTDSQGAVTGAPNILVSDRSGKVTVSLPPSGGGITGLLLSAESGASAPAPAGVDPQANTYAFIRTLPADADIAALPPTWNNVYSRVLANWAAMAPCMDNWLPLGDEDQVRAHAALLRRLTDPARFETYRFMPVTRDMTKGERALLYNFLNTPTASAVAARRPLVDNVTLARAMRRGPAAS